MLLYLVSENDHEDSYNELLTENIREAIDTLYSYKEEKFVYIKVFNNGKVIYRQFIDKNDLPSKPELLYSIVYMTDCYWDC